MSEAPLEALRVEIDAIDDQLHDLLMRRAAISEDIARVKGEERMHLRPGREATILRRLAARHRGPLPLPVLMRIWREILSGSIRLQGPFTIAVAAGEETRDLRDIARDHFGSTTPIVSAAGPIQAIRAVVDGTASVAVVPWPEENQPAPWWRALLSGDAKVPQVIARLPFLRPPRNDERVALAVAQLAPEPTGADHSLLVAELGEDVSRSRLKAALDAARLPPAAFWSAGAAHRVQLIEIADFAAPGDARIADLASRLDPALLRVQSIGGFALPMEAPLLEAAS